MAKFTDLPFEILRLIAANLPSLKCFSLVNLACRAASRPDLFRTLKVEFSENGLKTLEGLASSSLSLCVRALHYDASELVDPLIQHWDYFAACVYTPQEYARDQVDFQWNLRGKEFSYTAMYRYFRRLAVEQSVLLKERRDIHVFSECLPRLSNLRAIKITFNGAKEDQLLWFAYRLFLDGDSSFLIHVETIFRGMAAAYISGLTIETIEIDGTRPVPIIADKSILETARTALMPIKNFKVVNGLGILYIMSSVPLPSLRQFELANCWLVGRHLMRFLEVHGGVIQRAHFDGINLLQQRAVDGGASSTCPRILSEALSGAGNLGIMIGTLIIARDSQI